MSESKAQQSVEAGKQVGASFSYENAGETYWTSVGVQKSEGVYLVYVDEIREAKMSAEEFEREEMIAFDTIEAAAAFVDANTRASFHDLRPCKGQKVFNPAFYSPPSTPQ